MDGRRTRVLLIAVCTLALAATAARAADDCNDNPWVSGWSPTWRRLFKGIEWAGACTTRLPTNPNVERQRIQRVNVLRIDLEDPDIQFFTTPKATEPGVTYDTKGQVASQFLCEYGLQVAVNASFSWPCCSYEGQPAPNFDLCGLARSAGATVSELSSVPDPSYVGATALMITGDNKASFRTITAPGACAATQNGCVPRDVCTAVAGGPQVAGSGGYCPQKPVPGPLMLIQDGLNMSCPCTDAAPPEKVAARTAVGVSRDGRRMFLMTIDAAEGSASGAGFYDTAQWLLQLGAYNALNLDGGGSTTMVMQLPAARGGAQLLNHPSNNCQQRYVGNFLGVKAQWLNDPYVPPSGCGPTGRRTCSGRPKPVPACPAAALPEPR